MKQVFSRWRRFLKEEQELQPVTPESLFDALRKYDKHIWVFFDTETTGFPRQPGVQLTDLAAMGRGIEIRAITNQVEGWGEEDFHEKAKLTSKTRLRLHDPESEVAQRTRGLLSKTGYGTHDKPYIEEKELLENFIEWLTALEERGSVVLVAHNIKFDVSILIKRLNHYGLDKSVLNVPQVDSIELVRLYLRPILTALTNAENKEVAEKAQKTLNKMVTDLGNPSVSLKPVATSLGIEFGPDWHTAKADAHIILPILKKVVELAKENLDIDIRSSGYAKQAKSHSTAERERRAVNRKKRRASERRKAIKAAFAAAEVGG